MTETIAVKQHSKRATAKSNSDAKKNTEECKVPVDVYEAVDDKKGMEMDKKDDIWAIKFNQDDENHVPFSELSTKEKIKSVATTTVKITLVICCLYVFICSISMLGDAFQILAGKSAGGIFANDSFLSNPITGLIIGILVTVLVQSSSTSTSIVITMVAAGILEVHIAIPIIMGTNIGTSVTNTIVSLSQSMEKEQFRRAFAGATVHDIFNLLSVLVLLPLEVISGYLEVMTEAIIRSFHIQGGADAPDLLKVITDPFVKGIVVVNKTIITLVAQEISLEANSSMIKMWCEQRGGVINRTELANVTVADATPSGDMEPPTSVVEMNITHEVDVTVGVELCKSPEDFLFANTGLSDVEAGIILLFVSLFLLCFCLILMVKLLNSMLQGSVSVIIKKVINTNFRYPFGWITGYLAMIVGAGLTFVVQSSSVFTSTLTPLVGIGVVSLKRMYPLSLGANIGTTTTSILAALASDPARLEYSLQIALVHLFFNLTGILIWYPVPFMRNVPMRGAKALGNTTAKYRWFAVLYLVCVFFLIPIALLGLSLADFWALMSVVILVLVTVLFIIVTNVLQTRRPQWLPEFMRTWKFLPLFMRSLQPYDKFFSKYLLCKCCCKDKKQDDDTKSVMSISTPSTDSGSVNLAYENEKQQEEIFSTAL